MVEEWHQLFSCFIYLTKNLVNWRKNIWFYLSFVFFFFWAWKLITLDFHFLELVKLVERTIRSQNHLFPSRPIYLVGESCGGCLALAVAACNPDIDLVLILANPGKFCFKSTRVIGQVDCINQRSVQ